MRQRDVRSWWVAGLVLLAAGCAPSGHRYRDAMMDFGSIKTVAVLPFGNMSGNTAAADRVRTVFAGKLLASQAFYVLPPGEVAHGVTWAKIAAVETPSVDDLMKVAHLLKADAVVTGVVKEYGEVRSGNASANVVSVEVQLSDAASGKVVWSASTTRGGVSMVQRLLGGGGDPMNDVTERAVDDLIARLVTTSSTAW
jgi:hypothetical protein